MKTVTVKEISENHQDLVEFKYDYFEYKKDTKLRDVFNKFFSADIKAAFVATDAPGVDVTSGCIDWDGAQLLLVNAKGKVIQLGNSEWAHFSAL